MRVVFLIILTSYGAFGRNRTFPPGFLFGVAQSAFQVEGAWNIDGKKDSIWDHFVHENRSRILNRDTADVACDSYHLYREDVKLAAAIGMKMYRFSISWPRVLPDGTSKTINRKALRFYEHLVHEIRRHGMVPVATLYHWDLPQALMDAGVDWTNPKVVDHFVDYARIVIKRLHHVGYWVTVNEPHTFCREGYGVGVFAPGIRSSGRDEYKCIYMMMMAHATVYRMYKNEFPHHEGKMSMALDIQWFQPKNASSAADIAATRRTADFDTGLYAHPVFLGGWPPEAERRIAERSRRANLTKSRLPAFSPVEIALINGTFDFFGVNMYTGYLVENLPEFPHNVSSYEADVRSQLSFSPNWTLETGYFAFTPNAPLHILRYVKETYNNPEILILEIGSSDDGSTLYDELRIRLFHNYFNSILDAIYDYDVNVSGLNIWSILDNFEWASGYALHFGLYYVDMDDPHRTRYPKMSTEFVNQMTRLNRVPAIESIRPIYENSMRNATAQLNRIIEKMNNRSAERKRLNRPRHHLAPRSRNV
uniref:Glandular beta-glucosidase n=1 Tax=Phaedon cochleariae TaxID=80249 RepID=A0A0K8TW08_PHACE